jgi:DNA-binding beta-propeller fold protein YncE
VLRFHSRTSNDRHGLLLAAATAAALLAAAAPAQAAPFAYVTNAIDGTVSQYNVGAGGLLAPLSPPTVVAGDRPSEVAVSPNGKSVYVANSTSNSVSQYDVGPGGKLSPKSPPTVAAGSIPSGVAVSANGTSAYVTNGGDHTVSQYDVGPGGRLSPKSPAMVAAVFDPSGVAVSPDGRSAYVTNFEPSSISQYDVDAGGRLSPKSPATVGAPYDPTKMVVHPGGRSAYVLATGGTPSNFFFGVLQYNVGAGGRLSPKSPFRVPAPPGESPGDIAVSPDGRSVYVTNGTPFGEPGTVSQYSVSVGGKLSPKSPPTVPTLRGPGGVAVSGRSVYVTNAPTFDRPGRVSQYNIGAGGRLSPKSPPTVVAGASPLAVAVTPPPPGWEGQVTNQASGCSARVQVPYLDGNLQVTAYTQLSCPKATQLTVRSRLRSDYPGFTDKTVARNGCLGGSGCVIAVPKGTRYFRLTCPKSGSRQNNQPYYSDIVFYPGTNTSAATTTRSRDRSLSPFCAY